MELCVFRLPFFFFQLQVAVAEGDYRLKPCNISDSILVASRRVHVRASTLILALSLLRKVTHPREEETGINPSRSPQVGMLSDANIQIYILRHEPLSIDKSSLKSTRRF